LGGKTQVALLISSDVGIDLNAKVHIKKQGVCGLQRG